MGMGVVRACEESYRGYPYTGTACVNHERKWMTEAFPVIETIFLPKILRIAPAYSAAVRFYFDNPEINIVFC